MRVLKHSAGTSCLTLCDPMDCTPPDSSVHGILQARILEWVAMPSSKGSSWPRDQTCLLPLLHWQVDSLPLSHQGSPQMRATSYKMLEGFQTWGFYQVPFIHQKLQPWSPSSFCWRHVTKWDTYAWLEVMWLTQPVQSHIPRERTVSICIL